MRELAFPGLSDMTDLLSHHRSNLRVTGDQVNIAGSHNHLDCMPIVATEVLWCSFLLGILGMS
jgi:hypothetical protein